MGSASVLLEAGDAENAAFLCQQAIGKALKALIQAASDEAPPKIHNLLRLAALADVWDDMGDDRRSTLIAANPHAVIARYPLGPGALGAELAEGAPQSLLESSQEVVEWLLSRVS